MYIVINGGGKVASHLAATLLKRGHEVAVIEKRPDVAQRLAAELSGEALVILGDGCDVIFQEDAGAARADVFVSATGDDDDNLVACQLAKTAFGVPRAVARVNNPKNERIFNKLGIEGISSTTIISRMIEEEATESDLRTLISLRRGDMAIVQVELPTDRCVVCNKAVESLDLPVECIMVALVRDDEVIPIRAETKFDAGDTVIAFTKVEHEAALKRALTGS